MPDRPESDAIHTWFGLSYSNYLVLPRTLLQSMPDSWQIPFVQLLHQIRDAYQHLDQAPGYEVNPVDWKYANELTDAELAAAGVTEDYDEESETTTYHDRDGNELETVSRVAVAATEPIPHYNRGRTYIAPQMAEHPEAQP